jgi:hypothetical protein
MKRNSLFALSLQPGLALIAGLMLSSCVKQASPVVEPDISGVYKLVSVDGKPVPADIVHDQVTLQVRSGTFTLGTNGTCSTSTSFVPPNGTEVTREVSATFTRDGSNLTMTWKGAGLTVGTIDGDTFTMDNEGIKFVYKK